MKLLKRLLLPALALGLVGSLSAAVETYTIDPVHSSVSFNIRHFVSKVPGSFTSFKGAIMVNRDDMEKSSVEATIDTTSLSTANEKRDTHVKSPDFLDAAKFSTITFKSKSWKKTGEDAWDVTGDLTIKDVTKEVVLKTKLLAFGKGAKDIPSSGWEVTTVLKKSEFNASGPSMMAKALGDDVTVTINLEANAK